MEGKRRKILVPIRVDDVDLPLAFRHIQAADLTDWKGDRGHEGLESVVRSVAGLLVGAPVPPPQRRPRKGWVRIVLRWAFGIAALLIVALGLPWFFESRRTGSADNSTAQIRAASQSTLGLNLESPSTVIAVPSPKSEPRLLMVNSGANNFQVPKTPGHILFRIKGLLDEDPNNKDYLIAWYAAAQDSDNLVLFMLQSQQTLLIQKEKGQIQVASTEVRGVRSGEWMQVDIWVTQQRVSSRIKPTSGEWQDIGSSYSSGRDFTEGNIGVMMGFSPEVWISDIRFVKGN